MRGQGKVDIIFQAMETAADSFPVMFAGLDESGEFLQLNSADSGLRVEGLKVIAEVTVYVFMVVASGQFTELPLKAFGADVVQARRTPAIAAPVAKAFGIRFEGRLADDIDRTTFTHGEVVGWIERLGR